MFESVHWPRRVWMMFQILLLIYCNDIFVVEGGGAGEGDAGYCTNTLDRTLMTKAKKKEKTVVATKTQCTDKKEERYTHYVDESKVKQKFKLFLMEPACLLTSKNQ